MAWDDPAERAQRYAIAFLLCGSVLGMFAWCLYCWLVLW